MPTPSASASRSTLFSDTFRPARVFTLTTRCARIAEER